MTELAKEYIILSIKLSEAHGGWVSPHIPFNTREETEKWREEPNSTSPGLQV
jgi:hypothetical protein